MSMPTVRPYGQGPGISPEAPVPIMAAHREGPPSPRAGNVGRNCRRWASYRADGVLGTIRRGAKLRRMLVILTAWRPTHVMRDPPTTLRRGFVLRPAVLRRPIAETCAPSTYELKRYRHVAEEPQRSLPDHRQVMPRAHISRKSLPRRLLQERAHGIPVIADPKDRLCRMCDVDL